MNFDDLAALLPDNVKRNILARVLDSEKNAQLPAAASSAAAVQPAAAPSAAEDLPLGLASKDLRVPQMAAGAAILDGILSSSEIKAVSAAVESWLAQHGRRPGMGSSKAGGLWHDPSYRGDIHAWASPAELSAAGQPVLASCLQMLASLRPQLAAQGFDVSGRCSCQLACYPGNGARYVRHSDASSESSAPDRSVTALLYLNTDWDTQTDGGQLALYNTPHALASSSTAVTAGSTPDSSMPTPTSSSSSTTTTTISHKPVCSNSANCITQAGTMPAAASGEAAAAAASPASPLAAAVSCGDGAPGSGYVCGEPSLLVAPLGGRLLVFDSSLPHEVLPAHRTRLSITTWFYRGDNKDSSRSTPSTPAETAPAAPAAIAAPAPAEDAQAAVLLPCGAAGATASAQQLAAPAAAGAVARGPSPGALPTIFVSIAAFRDEECQWTLRDLFLQAAHPERVFVGVVWQVDPEADAGFVRLAGGSRTAAFHKQVREVRCHYSTATGPCAARSLAQQLWAGEDYVLQVDAHMRFVQGWDVLCISELQAAQEAAGHCSVVLSTYPLGYDGQGASAAVPEAETAPATLLCAKGFDEAGLLRVQSRCLLQRPHAPLPSHFWAAGLSFAPCSWLLEVPYCPHLPHLFFGEEQYMLLRMWTRGWDVFAPSQPLAFHQWERKARANSYQACVKIDGAARAASQARVQALTSSADRKAGPAAQNSTASGRALPSGPAAAVWHPSLPPSEQDWALGGVWGLGTSRSLQQYEEQAGVSFAGRALEPRSLHGGQPPALFQA